MIKTFNLEQENEINKFLAKTKGKIMSYSPKIVISYELDGMINLEQFRYAYTNPAGINIDTDEGSIIAQDIYMARNRLVAIDALGEIMDIRFEKSAIFRYFSETSESKPSSYLNFNNNIDFNDRHFADEKKAKKLVIKLRKLCSEEQLDAYIKAIGIFSGWREGIEDIRDYLYMNDDYVNIIVNLGQTWKHINKDYAKLNDALEKYGDSIDQYSDMSIAIPSEIEHWFRVVGLENSKDMRYETFKKLIDKHDFSNYKGLIYYIESEVAKSCIAKSEYYNMNKLIFNVIEECKQDSTISALSNFSKYLKDYEIKLINQEIARDKNQAIRDNGNAIRDGLISVGRATESGAKNIAESTERGLNQVAYNLSTGAEEISKGLDGVRPNVTIKY